MGTDMQQVETTALAAFDQWLPQIKEWEESTAKIVASPDKEAMAGTARESRLGLRRVRIEVEKKRKDLKEAHLRAGQEVDRAAKSLETRIAPLEAQLLEVEESVARREAAEAERPTASPMS